MANNFLARQIKRISTPSRIGIMLFGCILFALILFLNYTHGMVQGNLLKSIVNALFLPGYLTVSLWLLDIHRHKTPRVATPWHKQYAILAGLLFLSLSLLSLGMAVNILMDNHLPNAVSFTIIGVALLLGMCAGLRLFMLPRAWRNVK